MSDSRSSLGEPVAEPEGVDDVVGRSQDSLAEAEAAGRDAVGEEHVADAPVADEHPHGAESAGAENAEAESAAAERRDAEAVRQADTAAAEPVAEAAPAEEPADPEPIVEHPAPIEEAAVAHESAASEPVAETKAYDADTDFDPSIYAAAPVAETTADAPTEVVAPVVAPEAGIAAGAAAGAAAVYPAAPQPIFVQAPEAPRPRGNRAAAGAIGLLAALCFAVLYVAASLGIDLATGKTAMADAGTAALHLTGTWALWVPVATFFIAFWLLGAIINRGRWGLWVIFGLLVGFASYGGYILGQLFEAPFWMLTATQGSQLVQDSLFAPLAIAALVIGRELTIWFGAWVASRGKRVTELNLAAQREYERTLEAGPQLMHQQ